MFDMNLKSLCHPSYAMQYSIPPRPAIPRPKALPSTTQPPIAHPTYANAAPNTLSNPISFSNRKEKENKSKENPEERYPLPTTRSSRSLDSFQENKSPSPLSTMSNARRHPPVHKICNTKDPDILLMPAQSCHQQQPPLPRVLLSA